MVRCRRGGAKRGGRAASALSIAEYCNRSYDSGASTSNIHDVIFSVHFTSSTGDVRLSTPVDDRRRLDADFNALDDEDPDVCPYATFSEIEQMQTTRIGSQRPAATAAAENGTTAAADVQRRRPRPRRRDERTASDGAAADRRLEAPAQHPGHTDNDLHALYAQPHKLIRKDSDNLRREQSQI